MVLPPRSLKRWMREIELLFGPQLQTQDKVAALLRHSMHTNMVIEYVL
jgi:hypothetical protein